MDEPVDFTDEQMLAAKRLRARYGLSFPESFAEVLDPKSEIDVAAIAKEELELQAEAKASIVFVPKKQES